MRIAHVLPVGTSAETSKPIVALERDGAVYDVAELERRFRTKFAEIPGSSDFHTRVIALGCAGLATLDERLRSGDRPTEARLLPDAFLWVPPCAVERAAYVQLGAYEVAHGAPRAERPSYRIGNARAMLGHGAPASFPASEEAPDCELNLAAVLREDVRRVTPEEAERAIAGYTVLNDWAARGAEARSRALGLPPSEARDFATHLGPVLVTPDELGPVEPLRTRLRIDDEALPCARVGAWPFSLAESIAYVSEHIELRAGDVVGAGCVERGSAAAAGRKLAYGAHVELAIERVGKLAGKPVRGPEPVRWRRRPLP